jgi:hypothetical protein
MAQGTRKMYWLIALIAVASVVTLSASFSGKAQRKPRTAKVLQAERDVNQAGKKPSDKELDDAAAPIVDLSASTDAVADEKRRKKNKRFDNAQAESIEANPTSDDVSIVSESFIPDLPVAMSDLIVEGHVKDSNAFLSEDKTGIYSEFTVSVSDVIKAPASTPVRKNDLITAERFGGRVRFPSGQVARYRVAGQGAPMKEGKYLFFLRMKDDGSYLILTAYEMRGNKVLALDGSRVNVKGRGSSPFDKHNGKDLQEFKKEVDAAVRGVSQ